MYLKLTLKRTFILILCVWLAASCNHPEPQIPNTPPVDYQAEGVYVLNEGLYQHNNSTLTYYDFTANSLMNDIFLQSNGRGLGDTGNDLQLYGGKLYCVVNNSNRVEVMNPSDAKSIKAIQLNGKQPRRLAFYRDKAYVSCFDGDVVRIDTATLAVDATAHSGSNPEGICVCNGKLYVANSGGLNSPNYGNTVSVFDLATFSLLYTIEVETNPYILQSFNNKYVYVASRGNYGSIPYNFQKIDATADQVIRTYDWNVLNFAISGKYAYLYYSDYSTYNYWVKVMDLESDQIVNESFVTDGTSLKRPYGIAVNELNGDVYISDAYDFTVNGDIYCFDKSGKKKFTFAVGLNPGTILVRN